MVEACQVVEAAGPVVADSAGPVVADSAADLVGVGVGAPMVTMAGVFTLMDSQSPGITLHVRQPWVVEYLCIIK